MPSAVCIFPLRRGTESEDRPSGWDAGSLAAEGQESAGRGCRHPGSRGGQSQALVPRLDLWPTCSCRDGDLYGRHCPAAQLCCAVPVANTSMKPFLEVFGKNALIYPRITPMRKVNTL